MMPLTFANENEEKKILKLGGKPEVKQHLADLGFNVGSNIQIITKSGENVIVRVKDTRIALSKELANKILV
ncbi:MAG: ferrous iron transport protein A [Lachnospiraceae bacterium]|nr:ferrous iron transport protein A [Lachnospiraceae bacterium]